MHTKIKYCLTSFILFFGLFTAIAQKQEQVTLVKKGTDRIDISIGGKPFTSFLFPDSLEKPVLYPVLTAKGTTITRGFPLNTQAGDPIDHPHHIGIWFNFENLNGLDFWNNSYAIPAPKKSLYGWIKTDRILETKNGTTGSLSYHANWTNQQNKILAQETTWLEFSGTADQRIIDRITTLIADTTLLFTDAKDGMYAIRLAHALQIPTDKDQKFTDDKGNVTVVKGGTDNIPTGSYLNSTGRIGDSVWSTRASWCKAFGKINNDSVSVVIIDHPKNINYPVFWHARGYGLFAANALGEKIFTNGRNATNLQLKKSESVTFRYRIVIAEGKETIPAKQIDKLADEFAKKK